jgi:hypothetical protein
MFRPSEFWVPLRTLWLKVQLHVRALAAQCRTPLPRESASKWILLKKVARANTCRVVSKRNSTFVRQLVHQSEGATIAQTVSRCQEAEYRMWVKAMASTLCRPISKESTKQHQQIAPFVPEREKLWPISPVHASNFERPARRLTIKYAS